MGYISTNLFKMDSHEEPTVKRSKLEKTLWIKKSVYENLYLDEKTADVYFICGAEGGRIPGHKCIISKASPVFDAMFYGPNASGDDKDYSKWSTDVFKDFLKLCYLDNVSIDPDNIIGVMELSHESQMFDSLRFCGEIWADNMTIDDVCLAYQWAIHLEMDELKNYCERKIMVFPEEVFESTHFLSCNRVVLDRILDLETLLCNEKIVLQACLNWASHACEQDGMDASKVEHLKTFLQRSLYKVRYSSMTSTEFVEVVDSKDGHFFDLKDYEDIIRLTTGASKLRTVHFISSPRSSLISWKEDCAIQWDVSKGQRLSRYTNNKSTEIVKFGIRCSRTILLGGFHWVRIDNLNSLKITQRSFTEKMTIVHTLDRDTSSLDLSNSPIVIRPESNHEFCFIFSFRSNCNGYDLIDRYEELKLDKETTLGLTGIDYGISRGFKFNLL